MKRHRAIIAITVATVALAAFMPSTASAERLTHVEHAAAKKTKPLIATVNGTFTVRENLPGGFGNDNGPNWQQLKVVIKNAKIPFRAPNRQSAAASVFVRFEYEAEAHTQDRSWAFGCDSEDRRTYGSWSNKATVGIRETAWLRTNGKSKKYLGWEVITTPPPGPFTNNPTPEDFPIAGMITVTTGSYQAWESIAMTNCLSFEPNEPLGMWGMGFATPDGLGKLNSGNRSVPLTQINTEVDQIGTVTGSIKFNKSVGR